VTRRKAHEMDFAFTDAQEAVAQLARKIFHERFTPAALRAIENEPERFDRKTWGELASAGLLGTAIAEENGGAGHGFLELCALLEEAGAAVAPLPLWPTLVLGAAPVMQFGDAEMRARLLPGVASGTTILTAALAEPDGDDPLRVATGARTEGGSWKLYGTKTCVPAAALAERIVVPAATAPGAIGVFLVDPRAPGVKLARQVATTGELQYLLALDGAVVAAADVLGDPSRGGEVLSWLVQRATVALCAMELGVAERALAMTASYASTRQQFERPIATFQAVSQRAADAYVDVESMRVTTWQAAWRLAAGLPANGTPQTAAGGHRGADEAVSIAKFLAAEAGHRVVYAAQHLHGGMGYDLEYPLHRYYLLSKQIELTLGSASAHIARLGRALAE
jgi:3-oxocholest-4-en-26-oyl-CoA dehydrogenase beta subunit